MHIDVHAHLWTDEYLDLVAGYGSPDTHTQRNRGASLDPRDIDARFALMERSGVDMQVLSVSPQVPHFDRKDDAVNAARVANDMYADVVRRWPKRFAAFAALPMPHVDAALQEIDHALGQLGMLGVTLTTSILRRSVADPEFLPVYEELNRRKSVIFFHPTGHGVYSPLIADYDLTWMIGAPFENTMAAMHLVTRGIPTRFPDLKIIVPHIGGALPVLGNRLDSIYKWEYPQIPELPSAAVRRMWYDTVTYADPSALRTAVGAFGASQLVLGSDFPYQTGQTYVDGTLYIGQSGLDANDVERILGGNASALLGLG